jgi:hypothetical protein
MRLPDRSLGSTSPRFSRQSRSKASSSSPMMIRASEPPTKVRRLLAVSRFIALKRQKALQPVTFRHSRAFKRLLKPRAFFSSKTMEARALVFG